MRLLARKQLGRVIFTDHALPAVEPVAYVLDDGEALFQVKRTSALTAVRDTVVGFQVDDIDPENRTGWSVVGVGPAYEVTDESRIDQLFPRSGDADLCTIAVPLQRLTGHNVTFPAAATRPSEAGR